MDQNVNYYGIILLLRQLLAQLFIFYWRHELYGFYP